MSVRAYASEQHDSANVCLNHSLTFNPADGWSAPFPPLDSERTLIVVFAKCENPVDWKPLSELIAAFPQSKIIGCSSNTVINDGNLLEDSTSVGIIRFRDAELRIAKAKIGDFDDSRAAGLLIGAELHDINLKGVLLFSDGETSDATAIVRGMQEMLLPEITIAGGLSGGGYAEGSVTPWVLSDGGIRPMSACAVGLIGPTVEVVPATGGGWRQIGKDCISTRSHRRSLFELDGRPAVDVYREFIRNNTGEGQTFKIVDYPLAIGTEGLEMQIVRDVVEIDDTNGALVLAGDIPKNAVVRVMHSNADDILDGVDEAIERLCSKTILPKSNALCICISCMGRKLVMGNMTAEEPRRVQEKLGSKISQVGFYAFGEISTTTSGSPYVHNQTITLVMIREF